MKNVRLIFAILLSSASIALISCTAGTRAMHGYYRNHPEMQQRLLNVHRLSIAEVRGAENPDDAREMKACLIDELGRKGHGRFIFVDKTSSAEAVVETDMAEELGPTSDEPLPFSVEPAPPARQDVYARFSLTDPKTSRVIYKTDTTESPEVDVNSIGKAAYTVVKNLMAEIKIAKGAR
ncbi:MAG: hypothetical protein NT045_09845 [Candidatus Aureabacteria bacterium]|nr:hypothetical protein [Candidatus Auribacterota bacterium]